MADYMGTTVVFGGELPSSLVQELVDAMLDNGIEELEESDKEGRHASTYGETAYGQADQLCAILRDLGLTYRRTSEAKYEFEAEGEFFDGKTGERVNFDCTQSGEPSITLAVLLQRRDAGASLDSIITELQASRRDVPPLVIVEDAEEDSDEVTTAESADA